MALVERPSQLCKIEIPGKPAFNIETPPGDPKLHALMVLSAKRGGGKTTSLCSYLKYLKEECEVIDRVFLVTPTYASNQHIWEVATIEEEDVFQPSMNCLHEISKICEDEKEEFELFQSSLQMYEHFQTDKELDEHDVDPQRLLEYYERGWLEEGCNVVRPNWKYKYERPPRWFLVLDDCLNSDVMRRPSSGLSNLCIRHRHLAGGLGISIAILVQGYVCYGGTPRIIRENTTQLWLFRLNNADQLKKIYDECDLPLTEEDFLAMCADVHAQDYAFLMIDFKPEKPCQQFRRSFDSFVLPPSMAHVCTCGKENNV